MGKFILSLLIAYFLFAAVVQYNDPDPLHWMALYGATALACALALFGTTRSWLLWILLGMALTEMLITLDGFLFWIRSGVPNLIATPMSPQRPYIELTREFFGSLINLAVLAWLIVRTRGQK